MFEKQFEKLGLTDKDNFVRLVNQLLGHTFLLVDEYDFEEGVTRVNKDYLFVERNIELFQEYFSYAGFRLERDRNYGVIYLTSGYEGSRVRFDKLTTLIVYTLRLIYDEEREKLTLSQDVFCTVGDLVHKMISLGAVTKKPANASLNGALRTLSRFRVILKTDGAFDQPQTRLLILPTILFIVSNEQISNMFRLLDEVPGEETEMDEEEEDMLYEDDEPEDMGQGWQSAGAAKKSKK
jgi:hypothetical protein